MAHRPKDKAVAPKRIGSGPPAPGFRILATARAMPYPGARVRGSPKVSGRWRGGLIHRGRRALMFPGERGLPSRSFRGNQGITGGGESRRGCEPTCEPRRRVERRLYHAMLLPSYFSPCAVLPCSCHALVVLLHLNVLAMIGPALRLGHVIAMLLPYSCHDLAMLFASSCHALAVLLHSHVLAMIGPALRLGHVLAMLLPCVCHALAMLFASSCHDRPCAAARTRYCHALAMRLPCSCHALALFLPCPCHALTMCLPCSCHVIR